MPMCATEPVRLNLQDLVIGNRHPNKVSLCGSLCIGQLSSNIQICLLIELVESIDFLIKKF